METLRKDAYFDFLIIGGGIMGASTADAVKRTYPNSRVAWYIGKHKHTASNDFLKIIRDAYPEKVIGEYANQAMQKWKEISPYSDFFHQTSWIQAIGNTEKTMNKGLDDKRVTAAEMMNLVGSTLEPMLHPGEELYLNRNVGYADSALAVQAISDQAVNLGVKRYKENVTRLVIESGRCIGVEVGGTIVRAEKTIVSAGAWTLGLLKKSNIVVPSNFFEVTAVGVATLHLTEAEFGLLKSMPILVAKNGEVMLSQLYKVLKITTTETFRIEDPDMLDVDVDITSNREVLEKMLPQFEGRHLKSFSCPELLTPYQNPIVDYFPGIQQLILAAGGSYHSFKFLPEFGDIVVLCIRGEKSSDPLKHKIQERWSWNRPHETESVHPNIVPNR